MNKYVLWGPDNQEITQNFEIVFRQREGLTIISQVHIAAQNINLFSISIANITLICIRKFDFEKTQENGGYTRREKEPIIA